MTDRGGPPGGGAEFVMEALAHSTDLVVVADADLVIRFASRGALEALGYEPADVVGRSGMDFFHPDDLALFGSVAARAAQGYAPSSPIFYRLRHADGSYVILELAGGPVPAGSADEPVRGFWLVGRRPVRAEIYAEVLHSLLAGEPLHVALEHLGGAMVPDAFARFCITIWYDGDRPETVGHQLPGLLTGSEPRPGSPWELAMLTGSPSVLTDLSDLDPDITAAAGAAGLTSLTVIPVAGLDGKPAATLTLWTPAWYPHADASAEVLVRARELVETAIRLRQQIDQLKRTAVSDPLTGLANRRVIDDALARLGTAGEWSALYMDLDGFKTINDTYGHGVGDEVLKVVARRIQSVVRSGDVVARLGGDEFAVLCSCGPDDAVDLSERILEALRDPIVLQGTALHLSASIGVASAAGADREILRRADLALYQAKQAGRDRVRAS